MRKFINNMKNRATKAYIGAKTVIQSKKGEGYIDTAIKIIIAVVIGGLLLAGLYTLFSTTVMPTLEGRITEFFSYSGT